MPRTILHISDRDHHHCSLRRIPITDPVHLRLAEMSAESLGRGLDNSFILCKASHPRLTGLMKVHLQKGNPQSTELFGRASFSVPTVDCCAVIGEKLRHVIMMI